MQKFNLTKQSNGNFFIEGELTFSSLNKKTIRSFDILKQRQETHIDLTKVSSADSAGLALVLEWIKHSKQHNTKLLFKGIPQQLITLAALSGLDLNEYMIDIGQST